LRRVTRFNLFESTFGSVLHDGPDATNPGPILEFIADVLGLGLISWNALLSLLVLPWSRTQAKAKPAPERRQQSVEPIRILLDSEFRFVKVNPEFLELLGFSKSELVGKDVGFITAPGFYGILEAREQVQKAGKKNGYWLYRQRNGNLLLAHYCIWSRPDGMLDLLITPMRRRHSPTIT
jgi:PAS domain S-box-containing protein